MPPARWNRSAQCGVGQNDDSLSTSGGVGFCDGIVPPITTPDRKSGTCASTLRGPAPPSDETSPTTMMTLRTLPATIA